MVYTRHLKIVTKSPTLQSQLHKIRMIYTLCLLNSTVATCNHIQINARSICIYIILIICRTACS